MTNPISEMLGKASLLPQMIGVLKASSDPMAAINQMAATDPRMREVQQVINQNGSIQQAVYALARQKGVDPQAVLDQARQLLK